MSRSISSWSSPRRDRVTPTRNAFIDLAFGVGECGLLGDERASVLAAEDACVLVTVPPFTFRVLRQHDLDVTTSIFRVNRMFTLELPDCRGVW